MTTYKVGFHINGTGGHRGEIGEYMRLLDEAGIPFVINSVEDAGLAMEGAQFSGADHVVLFHKNEWSGAPNYNVAPELAGLSRWQLMSELLPPELEAHKDKIIFEIAIELDKNRADWVGRFMVAVATAANAAGCRVAGPSFSTGEPEPEHWETPGMLEWLRYLAEHPGHAFFTTHEYSLNANDIKEGSPWLLGRYQQMYTVCDEHGIDRPQVIISECGWAHNAMPDDVATTMVQIEWAAKLYGPIPFCLWTLGSGQQWGSLPQKLAQSVAPLTEWMLVNNEQEEDDVATVNEQMRAAAWRSKKISMNAKAALAAAADADGMWPMGGEFDEAVVDGRVLRGQLFGEPGGSGRWVYMAEVGKWGMVWRISALDVPDKPALLAPVGSLEERLAFAKGMPGPNGWPGEWQDANPYGNWYWLRDRFAWHTGGDLNLNKPSWNADKGSEVYAVADGDVVYAGWFNGSWGNLVVTRHGPMPHAPNGFYARYAHLDEVRVAAGDVVDVGEALGTVGGANVGLADHLHFDISRTDKLEFSPGDWPGSDLARLQKDYVDPRMFLLGGDGAPVEPARTLGIDVSHHNPGMDWQQAYAAGGRLALVRSTQGVTIEDKEFERNRNKAPKAGFSVVPWHFFQEPHAAGDQVTWFLQHTPQGYRAYGVDAEISRFEDGTLRYPIPNPNKVFNWIMGLFQRRPGCRILLYTNLEWLKTVPLDHPIRGCCDLWIAAWGAEVPLPQWEPALPAGWDRWQVWQYALSDEAALWGASSSQIDLDVFNGSLAELHAYAGRPEEMPVAEEEDPPAPEPEPEPALIDMLPYLQGDGRLYEVRNAAGSQERFQTQKGAGLPPRFYQTKNAQWELLWFDDFYIFRVVDTSPGGGRFYRLLENGMPGSRWIPRRWSEGKEYTRARRVQFYDKATCQPLAENSGDVVDTMRFVALHATYTFRTGITLPDVVELLWANGGERYFYARGLGLVGWERMHQDANTPQWSAISEIHAPGARPDNVRETGCFS